MPTGRSNEVNLLERAIEDESREESFLFTITIIFIDVSAYLALTRNPFANSLDCPSAPCRKLHVASGERHFERFTLIRLLSVTFIPNICRTKFPTWKHGNFLSRFPYFFLTLPLMVLLCLPIRVYARTRVALRRDDATATASCIPRKDSKNGVWFDRPIDRPTDLSSSRNRVHARVHAYFTRLFSAWFFSFSLFSGYFFFFFF